MDTNFDVLALQKDLVSDLGGPAKDHPTNGVNLNSGENPVHGGRKIGVRVRTTVNTNR